MPYTQTWFLPVLRRCRPKSNRSLSIQVTSVGWLAKKRLWPLSKPDFHSTVINKFPQGWPSKLTVFGKVLKSRTIIRTISIRNDSNYSLRIQDWSQIDEENNNSVWHDPPYRVLASKWKSCQYEKFLSYVYSLSPSEHIFPWRNVSKLFDEWVYLNNIIADCSSHVAAETDYTMFDYY